MGRRNSYFRHDVVSRDEFVVETLFCELLMAMFFFLSVGPRRLQFFIFLASFLGFEFLVESVLYLYRRVCLSEEISIRLRLLSFYWSGYVFE